MARHSKPRLPGPRRAVACGAILAMLGATAVATGAAATGASLTVAAPTGAWLDAAIDAFHATDLDGTVWSRDAMRGRVVLIDFWATWCAPCLAEIPALRRLRERYGEAGLEILGIGIDVIPRRSFVAWINRHDVRWPQVYDGRGRAGPVARLFRVSAVPTSFLFDREGRPVGMNLRGDALERAVADACKAGRPLARVSAELIPGRGEACRATPRACRSATRRR